MSFISDLISSIAVLVILILLGAALRSFKILKEGQSALFAKIVTSVTLPAVIFVALSDNRIDIDQLLMSGAFILAELGCFVLAWGSASLLRLSRPKKGAFILAAMFGSSAFLGYPLVAGAFPGQADAMSDAVMVSELGVGTLIFTVGVMIAMYYGSRELRPAEIGRVVLDFLKSPVCIAIAAGIMFSMLSIARHNNLYQVGYGVIRTIGQANTLMVALTIGLMLKLPRLKSVIVPVLFVSAIKLVIQPLLAVVPAGLMPIPEMGRNVLVLEAAMPSASLAAVFARRYGCDGELASVLVLSTLIVSMISVPLVLSV